MNLNLLQTESNIDVTEIIRNSYYLERQLLRCILILIHNIIEEMKTSYSMLR